MVWLRADPSLSFHPKTLKLAKLVSVSVPTAIGHLFHLWWWAATFARDGDVTDLSPVEVSVHSRWAGVPAEWYFGLLRAGEPERVGFLEKTESERVVLHDWEEHAGRWLRDMEQRAMREGRRRLEKRLEAEGKVGQLRLPPRRVK